VPTPPPIVLTIAGSDPSGGAGVQGDLKTFAALGAYGCAVVTLLTAQNTLGVIGVFPVAADVVRAQLDSVLDDVTVGAVKIGALGTADVVRVVADALRTRSVPFIVVDPVIRSSSGATLLDDEAVAAMRSCLLPLATVITPNRAEAGVLLEAHAPNSTADALDVASLLLHLGPKVAVVTGGDADERMSTDVVGDGDGVWLLESERVPTRNDHGTGCAFSSAIAVGLATHGDVTEALRDAKAFVTAALLSADTLSIGLGRGPVNHSFGGR
jgi:hydroxymethylpyrimidine/phosphomethylpyrimidine kinase